MSTMLAAPAALDRRRSRAWRLLAVMISLGLLAVTVPHDALSRRIAVTGLIVLALAVASAVLVRHKGRHVRTSPVRTPVEGAPVPDPPGVNAVADGEPVADVDLSAAADVDLVADVERVADVDLVADVDALAVVHEDARAEFPAAGGDAMRTFLAEVSARATQQPPVVLTLDQPDLAVATPPRSGTPAPSGSGADRPVPTRRPDTAMSWQPMDDEVKPTLQSGWPFI